MNRTALTTLTMIVLTGGLALSLAACGTTTGTASAPSSPAVPTPSASSTNTPVPAVPAPAVPAPTPAASAAGVTVTEVVDGDSVNTSDGSTIRIIGIDTPEAGQCGYAEATAKMKEMTLGHEVLLGAVSTKEDKDKYGRPLRYVDLMDGVDAGREQIGAGLATARYDGRDGYGTHNRESEYVALDAQVPNFTCHAPPPAAQPDPKPEAGCKPNYSPCVPTGRDYDCNELHDGPYIVRGPDTDRLDRDHDGVGCE